MKYSFQLQQLVRHTKKRDIGYIVGKVKETSQTIWYKIVWLTKEGESVLPVWDIELANAAEYLEAGTNSLLKCAELLFFELHVQNRVSLEILISSGFLAFVAMSHEIKLSGLDLVESICFVQGNNHNKKES